MTRNSSRRLRFASGQVLLAYVASHLANHALGLVSLAVAEAARVGFVAFWRSPPATAVFYAALLTHIALALAALYQRRTLRMPPLELLRLVLGLSIPFLLAAHFTGTRAAYALFGQDDTYARVASGIWARDAGGGQLLLILAAWTHGCLGLHFAFRHRARWRRVQSLLVALATLLPALAYLGLASMAREIAARPAAFETLSTLTPPQKATLSSIADGLVAALALAIVVVMLARLWRDWRSRRPGRTITITYPGKAVRVPLGYSVLEASRLHGIPHLSLCGGRARCSTCRVRVQGPPESLPAAEEAERRTLLRIAAPPDTRLACQLRPASDITVTPLLAPTGASRLEFENLLSSAEREVAILFIDLRRWTTLSEGHLPFDLVYVLDQYFTAVGDAVREAGGVPNQFIGDSVMAIFGLEVDIAAASRQAVAAAAGIERRMALLNIGVQRDFGRGLDFGIGIHAGVAVVGSVGYRETRTLSAVGDAVNTASRLQELTKEFGVNLVLSERVAREAGLATAAWPAHRITLRGRATELTVFAVSALSGA